MVCGVFASRSTAICIRSSLRRRRRQQSPWRLCSCPNDRRCFQRNLQERKGSRPATAACARTTRNSPCRTNRGGRRVRLIVLQNACHPEQSEGPHNHSARFLRPWVIKVFV